MLSFVIGKYNIAIKSWKEKGTIYHIGQILHTHVTMEMCWYSSFKVHERYTLVLSQIALRTHLNQYTRYKHVVLRDSSQFSWFIHYYVFQILALMIAFPLILRVWKIWPTSLTVDPLFWLLKFGMIISQFLTRFVKNVIGFDLSGNSSITEGFHSSWTSIVKTIIFLIGCIVNIGPTSPLENRLHESKWVWEWVISGKYFNTYYKYG